MHFPKACKASGPRRVSRFEGARVETWRLTCEEGGLASEATHIEGLSRKVGEVLVLYPGRGDVERSARVAADDPALILGPGDGHALGAYALLGIEHIALGIDHLLFVLGLMLLIFTHTSGGEAARRLIWTITAFTLAHSITLAAATLGVISLPSDAVETVIAMSIVLLALELSRPKEQAASWTASHPGSIAFVFGLLHGFGFAGALSDLGLPPDNIPGALLLFNLGVEVGQLGFVALASLIGWLIKSLSAVLQRRMRSALVHALGGLAVYWTLERGGALVMRWLSLSG